MIRHRSLNKGCNGIVKQAKNLDSKDHVSEFNIECRSRGAAHLALSLRWSVKQLLTCLYKGN